MNGFLQEVLSGMRVVHAFQQREPRLRASFRTATLSAST